jgi:hypothetical protein
MPYLGRKNNTLTPARAERFIFFIWRRDRPCRPGEPVPSVPPIEAMRPSSAMGSEGLIPAPFQKIFLKRQS